MSTRVAAISGSSHNDAKAPPPPGSTPQTLSALRSTTAALFDVKCSRLRSVLLLYEIAFLVVIIEAIDFHDLMFEHKCTATTNQQPSSSAAQHSTAQQQHLRKQQPDKVGNGECSPRCNSHSILRAASCKSISSAINDPIIAGGHFCKQVKDAARYGQHCFSRQRSFWGGGTASRLRCNQCDAMLAA